MTEQTLKKFKERARKFSELYNSLIKLWNGELEHGDNATYPETIIVGVIVHNIAFDGSDCMGYSHEHAVQKVKDNLEALRKINEYEHRTYMTHYPYTELTTLWDGCNISEYFDS